MSDYYADYSILEIENEIRETNVLIATLVNVVDPEYAQRRMTLERELKLLESVLDAKVRAEHTRQYREDLKFLERSHGGTPPQGFTNPPETHQRFQQSSFNDSLLPTTGFSAYAGHGNIAFDQLASDSALSRPGSNSGRRVPLNTSSLGDSSDGGVAMSAFSPKTTGPSPDSASTSSPDHGASFPSTPMPERPSNSRKRPRESLSLSSPTSAHVSKAIRTTPSPAETNATSPSSVGSFDFPDNPEFYRLMGGDPREDMREMRKEQKAREKMLQEKREQERKDEAFARQLMQDDADFAAAPVLHGWNDRNGLLRANSQTMIDDQGRVRRPEPSPWPVSSPPTQEQNTLPTPHWMTPHENAVPRTSTTQPSIKYENSQLQSNPSPFNTDEFIDLGSSEESDGPPEDESNDLILINPPAQNGNHRYGKAPRNLPWMDGSSQNINRTYTPKEAAQGLSSQNLPTNNAVSYPYNNPYQANVGYGGTNVYDTLSNTASASSFSWGNGLVAAGENVMNAAKGHYNAAYGLLDSDIARIPSAPPGFGSSTYEYGTAGTSSNPYLIPDVYGEDFSQASQSLLNSMLGNHAIDMNGPQNQQWLDQYMDRYNYLKNDPTKTTAEIKSLLENIRPDEEFPPENREGTPDAMTHPLMEHQRLGLTWMINMEEGSNKGGILADDMGLGKTIQALALMVARRSSDPRRKTTLIVAPVALMKQWQNEIQKMVKPGKESRLTSYILHGANRQASWEHLRTFDVVLTTFGTLAMEIKRKEGIDKQKRVDPNWRPISKADNLPLLGDDCKWYRVIIDEAQCIKNKNTKAALGAAKLQSLTRFCMTGTPMMNNVTELYSLIHFLRIKPYNVAENFNRDFTRALKSYNPAQTDKAMQKFQALLKAILLRRTKKSKIDGKPILELPPRTTNQEQAVFSEDEEAVYRALETQSQLQFNRYLKAGTVGRNYSNVLVLLLRLRQACCHPHLIKDFGVSSGVSNISEIDLMALAKELSEEVVARIKEQGRSNDQGALECPVCIDMAENATIFIPCGHSTCSECFARISDPSQAILGGDIAEGRNIDIKCPNCRGKVNPAKVIDHNTFKKVHMPDEFKVDVEVNADTTDESDSDSDSENEEDDDADSVGSLKDFIVDDDADSEEKPEKDTAVKAKRSGKGETPEEISKHQSMKNSMKRKQKSKEEKKGRSKKKASLKTLAQLKKASGGSARAKEKYLNRLKADWEPSSKIEKVMEILQATRDRNEGEKTIVFSQFTSLLDLLEVPISGNGWDYKRYDGSMSSKARDAAVQEFSFNPRCTLMLISLKAGNAGLNLVAASQVIIFDPFWNPYIEEQAIDRAHRIGQMKPVQVHRILVPNTVEDRIVALQEKKRALIEGALDEQASQNIGRLGTRELAFLFVSFESSFTRNPFFLIFFL